ncbi:hypothetical protein HU200_027737 [Digitaria exilis]|uniref:Uncharacterized protein n=1 Tax=Digitaria exilis TaxID=1010633 RepID=A0A835ER45_9POAL|nr:hypothetical protein HU200_027737 [Digitaria exilis]
MAGYFDASAEASKMCRQLLSKIRSTQSNYQSMDSFLASMSDGTACSTSAAAQEQAEQPSRGPKQPAACQPSSTARQGIRSIPACAPIRSRARDAAAAPNGARASLAAAPPSLRAFRSLASARCGGGAGGAQRRSSFSRARGPGSSGCCSSSSPIYLGKSLSLNIQFFLLSQIHSTGCSSGSLPLVVAGAVFVSSLVRRFGAAAVLRLCGVVLQSVVLFVVHLGQVPGSSAVRRSSSFRVAAVDVPAGIDIGSVSPSTSRFDDSDRWQIKTRMWLTDLKMFWVVAGVVPEAAAPDADDAAKATAKETKEKWDEANQACLSRLLNVISNRLFDLYSKFESAKALWTELESEFSEVDKGNESFATESYLKYKMVEGRSVMEQLQELQLLVRDLVQYNCLLPDNFQMNVILAKLPPSWRDFVTVRRHMKTQLTLPELTAAINVEERARASNKPVQQVQAHMVERGAGGKSQKKKKGNFSAQNQNKMQPKKMKKKKEDLTCYVCGQKRARVLILSARKEMWWLIPPLAKTASSMPAQQHSTARDKIDPCSFSDSLASARCGGGAGGAQRRLSFSRARGSGLSGCSSFSPSVPLARERAMRRRRWRRPTALELLAGAWAGLEWLLVLLLAYVFGEVSLPQHTVLPPLSDPLYWLLLWFPSSSGRRSCVREFSGEEIWSCCIRGSIRRPPWPGARVLCCAAFVFVSGRCRRRSRRHRQRLSISVNLPLR